MESPRDVGGETMEHGERPERAEPLTDAEREIIQNTWVHVYENCEDVGVSVLIRYVVRCVGPHSGGAVDLHSDGTVGRHCGGAGGPPKAHLG